MTVARTIAGFVLAGLIGAAVVGCSSPAATTSNPSASVTPTSPVTGVLVHIDAAGLADVKAFTLRLADGSELLLAIGVLENGAQFPPGHLAEHMASSSPIRAFFRSVGPELVVYRIEDAPTP
jgi:hypothetical protein